MRRSLVLIALVLASCTSSQPPDVPPPYVDPPEVATDGFVSTVSVVDVPMGLEDFRAFLIEQPFIGFLAPTETIFPPVSEEALQGEWLNVGAVRRLTLGDGHYVIERVLENEPEIFRYQVWVFTNDAARGVEQIVGEQRFTRINGRTTRFEWSYNVKPRSFLTRPFVKQRQPELQRFMDNGTAALAAGVAEAAKTAP
ncbi:MAG: hypothetical protein AAGA39_04865 [Pseudomonadota bacterium]